MTDIYDQATDTEEQHRVDALARHARQQGAPMGDWRETSAKWCEGAGCGVRIPDERRRAVPGVQLCVDCQEFKEEQQRRQR